MFEQEFQIAHKAVIHAMRLSKVIQNELTNDDSMTKSDKSPVTVADFAAQAIICRILKDQFPNIPIVAEENSDALRGGGNQPIIDKIKQYISSDNQIRNILNKTNLFESIDLGCGSPNNDIFWTLDPIDGTKGFLRGEQFAIALALIVKGPVKLGILGCPNLKLPIQSSTTGYLLYAEKGMGSKILNIENNTLKKATISSESSPGKMRFVESYVSSHSNMEKQLEIAKILKIANDPVQMDSQVKYAVVASGTAEIYMRIPHPKTPDYREKIWDHAAGSLIVKEAGGRVADIEGQDLDFGAGPTLKNNRGIIASTPSIYPKIIETLKGLN